MCAETCVYRSLGVLTTYSSPSFISPLASCRWWGECLLSSPWHKNNFVTQYYFVCNSREGVEIEDLLTECPLACSQGSSVFPSEAVRKANFKPHAWFRCFSQVSAVTVTGVG